MAVATRWPMVGRRDELDTFVEALADPGCEGFCIYGPSGVGKTRLGEECVALAEATGRRVLRATADRSVDAVPLGAVAHLLPALSELGDRDVNDSVVRARLLEAARVALTPTAGDAGIPLLLLDDAHRFDGTSLMVVDHLLAQGALFCVATVTTGEAIPETVTRWWRDERATRIDLTDLDQLGVDTLLHVVLEGPLDAGASSELWGASRGNVLALRELVLGARARQVLVESGGAWRLTGPLGTTTRLRELVEGRIGRLEPRARAVLELLALCEPVGLGPLEASAGLVVLEQLEREGLIVVGTDRRRESVRLAHPLHGEVLRAELPALRARSILLSQADALEDLGARRREDSLRIATWHLEATGRADPDLLLRAARLARYNHDYRQAVRLARAALAAKPSAAAGLVVGEALYNLGLFEDAESVLAAAGERAVGDDEIVRIATVRRRNLFRGCGREAEAVAVGQTISPRLVSAAARDELLTGEAEILAFSGRPADALARLEQVNVSAPRLKVLAAIPRAAALAMMGRTAEALELSEQAYRDHIALGDELAIAFPGTHLVTHTFALVQAGRLAEAEEKGALRFDFANRGRSPLGVVWLGVHLGRCALIQGRPTTAIQWAERASQAAAAAGFNGLRPMAYAIQAVAHGLLGDASASAACADQMNALTGGFGFLAAELPLGRAWALVAAGAVPAARALLLDAAEDTERTDHVLSATWLLHDATRLGAASEAAPRLAVLAARTDSALAAARAEHAAAVVADDGDRLAAATDQLETLGALLPAAEAAAAGADAWRRRKDPRRAAALDVRSSQLAAGCQGAMTPGLVRARAVVPLTDRERDVAMLAAAGHPSRVIADRLYLSVRTVDNHLGRVYDKLGVSSRAALAAALQSDAP